jgi:hypothetical protein
MLGIDLVRPLEEIWREVLDMVGHSHGWPTSHDVARLGARVAELSAAYNDPERARSGAREGGAARLGFSFARDVPKGAAAVRELLAVGALPREGPLRVLDLGAGLGAMTWGLHRARAAAGGSGSLDATWVDGDGAALDLGLEVLRERQRRSQGAERLTATPLKATVDASSAMGGAALRDRGPFDLVFVGHVLSELDVGAEPLARAATHAAWLQLLLDRYVAPSGSLVVVEPALRERTRHLHRVRDALLAKAGAAVFAPCTHAEGCPALADERDWCHENLRIDLPPWLVPVARAAGLRYEGLTFSYVVLRKDGATLNRTAPAPPPGKRLRVVSDRIKSKGKLDLFLCGEFGSEAGTPVVGRVRTTRLDRDASDVNRVWQRLGRGDVVDVAPALDVRRPRVGASNEVSLVGAEAGAAARREVR